MPDMSSVAATILGLALGFAVVRCYTYLRQVARRGIRPVGITLIAVFQIGTGLLLMAAFAICLPAVITRYDEFSKDLAPFAFTPEGLMVGAFTMAALAIAGGIGLWRGTPIGWRIAMFAIACSVVRNVLSLLLDGDSIVQLGQSATAFYVQHAGRAVLATMMLIYLYRPTVLRHCSLSMSRRLHAVSLAHSVVIALGLEMIVRQLSR